MQLSAGTLVDAPWLAAHLDEVVVAEVRWSPDGTGRPAFERGHLPRAVYLDADADLAGDPVVGPGRHPLPSPASFATTLGRVGIGDDTPVVAYDDAGGSYAARLWWMLDVLGHPVAVLNGGLAAWAGEMESGPGRRPTAAVCTPRPWPRDRTVGADEVVRALASGGTVLDARASERFRGETEPYDRVAGHIPGAVNLPWTGDMDPGSQRFLHARALRARFAGVGADGADVIAHCGSGITACHLLLARRVADLPDGKLYVGSWSDWIADPDRPVAVGR
jgi:thiosulfate/3-mercaptopyruvate sulfurtransferase